MKALAFALGLCAVATLVAAQAAAKGDKRRTAAPVEKVELGVLGLLGVGGNEDAATAKGPLPPGTLARGQNAPHALVVDKTNLYWLTANAVMKAPLAGGRPVTLAANQSGVALALDGKNLYWTTGDPTTMSGSVMSVPVAGGKPRAIAQHQSVLGAIAVDATDVYWISQEGDGAIKKAPLAGGETVTFARTSQLPLAVAVDATNVYWTSAVGEVFKQEKTSDAAVKLATFQIDAYHLALDGTSLYWAAGGGGAIAKLALAGGEPSTLADQQTFASALAVDGGRVYWARRMTLSGKGGSILSVPLAGGEPTTIAAAQAEPVALAVGPKEIYWANRGDGTIHKAKK